MSVFGILWALVLVPSLMELVFLWQPALGSLFRNAAPGTMRSVLLFLWLMVMVYPISNALQEITIGQWEILLSSSVTTRSIMIGKFVAKIPIYCLTIFFLAPILLTPFVIVFAVSMVGQLVMYTAILLLSISTLWASTVLSSAVQMRLSQSARGDDLAKIIGMVISLIIIIPMMAMMNFAGAMSEFMTMDVFLIFPFTWGADMASWAVLLFNGIGLSGEEITLSASILGFDILTSTLLLCVFVLISVGVGLASADRLFALEVGPRTETVKTTGKENLILKGIRRIIPGPLGVLTVMSLKDFFRKPENTAKLMLGLIFSVIPVLIIPIVSTIAPVEPPPMIVLVIGVLMMIMLYPMIGGLTFGGIGFLESKNHLWIIQSAPRGSTKFVKARILAFSVSALPMAIIPAFVITFVQMSDLLTGLTLAGFAYMLLIGSTFVGVGIASLNPTYESIKSSSHYVNVIITVGIILGTTLVPLMVGIRYIPPLVDGAGGFVVWILLLVVCPMMLVGSVLCYVGARNLAKPD